MIAPKPYVMGIFVSPSMKIVPQWDDMLQLMNAIKMRI